MNPPLGDSCFVDEVSEPVRWLDVVPGDATTQPTVRSHSVSSFESLNAWFTKHGSDDYSCRFMYVCLSVS